MVVLVDNMDIPPGECRLRLKGSSAGHNGIKSLMLHAGTGDFRRIFIGVGRPGPRGDVVKYVLGTPSGAEAEAVGEGVAGAADAVLRLLEEDPARVMNDLNRKKDQ